MRKQPTSRYCFICGRENPVGLKMNLFSDDMQEEVRAIVTVPEHFNGYPGVVHGGVVAAILDETAGRAVLIKGGDENLMMTIKLEVNYKRPTPTETPLTVIGRVIRQTPKRANVWGEIRLADETVTATCKAFVLKPPPELIDPWEEERSFWRVED